MTEKVKNLMRSLKISEAEAKELLEYDEEVDHAKSKQKLKYDLTDEQEKATRKWRQADRKPTVYNFDTSKRERKPNVLKGELIKALFDFLNENTELSIENCVRISLSFPMDFINFSNLFARLRSFSASTAYDSTIFLTIAS